MSSCQTSPIKCPKCGYLQDFTTWQSLNANLHPELKDRLLSGELTRFTCNECHASCEVMYPMLYHDTDRKLMVHFAAGGDPADLLKIPFGGLMKGYQFRQCASRNELVEKVWIFGADFDDRAMELFKRSLYEQMATDPEVELYFSGAKTNADGQELVTFVLFTGQDTETIAVDRESYTHFADEVAELLKLESTPPGEWLHINRSYAVSR